MANPLILAVDLDEWFHCRWATGSKKARWSTLQNLFAEYYHANRPAGEIIPPTQKILKILKKRKIRATFFVLGEVAQWYPELVATIAHEGHEIACHGLHHQDLTLLSPARFEKELRQSRQILERIYQKKIIGFRAPNLVVTPWLKKILVKNNFLYDSSICPSRNIQGKYCREQLSAPLNPYRTAQDSLLKPGNSSLFEIPIPASPILRLPGAVSIATRIFGSWWTFFTLDYVLKTGAADYYLHPYEFNPPPKLSPMRLKEKIFLARLGKPMETIFLKLLTRYQGRIISCRDYLEQYEGIKISQKLL